LGTVGEEYSSSYLSLYLHLATCDAGLEYGEY